MHDHYLPSPMVSDKDNWTIRIITDGQKLKKFDAFYLNDQQDPSAGFTQVSQPYAPYPTHTPHYDAYNYHMTDQSNAPLHNLMPQLETYPYSFDTGNDFVFHFRPKFILFSYCHRKQDKLFILLLRLSPVLMQQFNL